MYFNDVNILYYLIAGILGVIVGQIIDYTSKCFFREEKILRKENFRKYRKTTIPNFFTILCMVIINVALVYKFGIYTNFIENLELIKYLILVPLLLCALIIDFKKQIMPNRLNLLIFEIGLMFIFIYGFVNINLALNLILGGLVGGGIFVLIALLGGLIAGKEAMGFGDVKFIGAIGIFFGFSRIIAISLMSFLLGAIISIILMIFKTKKANEYIPFGPFISIASIITIFVPFNVLYNCLLTIFTLGLY